MKLTFTDGNGKVIILDIKPSKCVMELKLKLLKLTSQWWNIELDGIKLPIIDYRLIQDVQINEHSSLRLFPVSEETMAKEMEQNRNQMHERLVAHSDMHSSNDTASDKPKKYSDPRLFFKSSRTKKLRDLSQEDKLKEDSQSYCLNL